MVAFTSNLGLAKPTNSELAKNWIESVQYQDDNNTVIENAVNLPLTSYTPALAATTTPFSFGAGAIRGEYQDIQGIVKGSFVIEFLDPGVAVGNGEYGISLPFVADNVYHSVGTAFNSTPGQFSCIGEGYIFDNSNFNTSGTVALDVVTVGGISYARLITETHAGKTSRIMRDSMPFPLATLDKLTASFIYKKT